MSKFIKRLFGLTRHYLISGQLNDNPTSAFFSMSMGIKNGRYPNVDSIIDGLGDEYEDASIVIINIIELSHSDFQDHQHKNK